MPGTADVGLAAYDPMTGRLIEDDRGFVKRCADDEFGLLLGRASSDTTLPIGGIGGVFKAGDAWVPTENLFWRDNEGDYWLADHKDTVIKTVHGPVYTQPVCDVLDEIRGIDVSVCYGLPLGRHDVAVAAVSVVPGRLVTAAEVTEALRGLLPAERPDLVRVVDEVPLSPSFRPTRPAARAGPAGAGGPVLVLRRPRGRLHRTDREVRQRRPCAGRVGRQAVIKPVLDETLLAILACPQDKGPLLLIAEVQRERRCFTTPGCAAPTPSSPASPCC